MAYTQTSWTDDAPPAISAANLNKIETGIEQAHDALLPTGGTTDQVLAKNSATDYDTKWATAAAGSGSVPNGTASRDMLRWSSGVLALAAITYSTPGANGLLNYFRTNTIPLVATQSSTYSARDAGLAIDGTLNTHSHTNTVASSWWKVDLGVGKGIVATSFGLGGRNEAANFPKYYRIEGSNDDSAWTTLYATSGGGNELTMNTWTNVASTGGTWRYFRFLMTGLSSSGTDYLVLGEFEVYGTLYSTNATPGWIVEPDAPSDGSVYGRKNGLWAAAPPILVLGPADPVPGGTAAGTVIIRKES